MQNTQRDSASGRSASRRHLSRYATLAAIVLATAGLTSCSQDDSINPEPTPAASTPTPTSGREIAFRVIGENSTRASQIYSANNIPSKFYVSAWAMDSDANTQDFGRTYIKSDLISNSGTATSQHWTDQSGLRYWPNNGELLNFFATNAQGGKLDYEESGQGASQVITNPKYMIPFTVNPAATGQLDLLYAYAFDQKATPAGADGKSTQPVTLDFHHALSQVVFTAQCSNPHLDVKIGSISIVGVAGNGTLTMAADRQSDSGAVWNIPTNYTPGTFGSDPDSEQGGVNIGSAVTNITAGGDQTQYALMMIPQTVAAADPTQSSPWSGRQAFLKVQCVIYNVARGEGAADSDLDTMVFGSTTDLGGYQRVEYGTLYIPISVDWQMGKRYVYNLQFGQGGGGYNQDGTKALIPIQYKVTNADWIEAGSTNVHES